jgi:NADPH-dependent curcumin reductase CurA
MTDLISREIQLVSRPQGMPTAANFALVETKLELLKDEWVLVRNLYLSVDPYMRGRMNDCKSYVPPFELGKAMDGGAVGEVIESHAEKFKPGVGEASRNENLVTSNFGWREYFMAAPQQLHPVSREMEPSIYLGALGITGLTAWAGLNLVDVKAGDIIFISGAAGAVGNMAGQLAKLRGCETIGSAGSPEKVEFLVKDCGFDVAFDYKHDPLIPTISLAERLHLVALNGIDVYFDNVGGEMLEAALSALRVNGRIIACGGISGYNAEKPQPAPSNLFNITTKRLTMKGLIVSDWLGHQAEFEREVGGYFRDGKLKNKQTVVVGIDKAVSAFLGLFDGKNIGKMVVKLE